MEMTVPTANPLNARSGAPVYVALVPGGRPNPSSNLSILSGFGDDEDAEIHRLSKLVIQLAVVNCLVSVTIRVVALVIAIVYSLYSQILSFFVNVLFSLLVLYLGIRGVKTRNAQCAPCCCGPLTAFYVVYIVLAVVEAMDVLVALINRFVVLTLVDVFFLVLYAVTAEQARRLLEVLALAADGEVTLPPPQLSSPPLAEATEIGVAKPGAPEDNA